MKTKAVVIDFPTTLSFSKSLIKAKNDLNNSFCCGEAPDHNGHYIIPTKEVY
jgi:hypothetical protein